MNVGNVVELKRDNLNGIGNKGDKGISCMNPLTDGNIWFVSILEQQKVS